MNRPTNKQIEHDWVEAYLTNQLRPTDRAAFEAALAADPDFQHEVAIFRRTHELMQEAFIEQRTIDTVKHLQRQHRQRTRRIRLGRRLLTGVTASVALLVGYLSITPVVFPDSENDISVTRSLTATRNTGQNQVFQEFFDGQAHLSEGQYALAVTNFERVLSTVDIRPYFREAAQWHLTVAYLKSGQSDKAERLYDRFVACIDCEYPISLTDRWKIWWQIKWAQWLGK